MTSKGIPFQTAEFPPPRKVGTPDSAETPAPVNTRTRVEQEKRRRSSTEIVGPAMLFMWKADGSRAGACLESEVARIRITVRSVVKSVPMRGSAGSMVRITTYGGYEISIAAE